MYFVFSCELNTSNVRTELALCDVTVLKACYLLLAFTNVSLLCLLYFFRLHGA